MKYFLRQEKRDIWSQVQGLASKGDIIKLQQYVLEAQHLTCPQRNIRFPAKPTEVEGKSVRPGDVLVLNIVSLAISENLQIPFANN